MNCEHHWDIPQDSHVERNTNPPDWLKANYVRQDKDALEVILAAILSEIPDNYLHSVITSIKAQHRANPRLLTIDWRREKK